MAANELGALSHAWQAPMSASRSLNYRRINPLTVVADEQAQLAGVIFDVRIEVAPLRVPEAIANRLAGNPVDVVSNDRMEISRCALDVDMKRHCALVG